MLAHDVDRLSGPPQCGDVDSEHLVEAPLKPKRARSIEAVSNVARPDAMCSRFLLVAIAIIFAERSIATTHPVSISASRPIHD